MASTFNGAETLQDFVTGLAFFGTGGGGGRLEDALSLLQPILDAGASITLVDADELPPDTWTCSVSSFGGREGEPPSAEELRGYGLVRDALDPVERMVAAVRALEELRGVTVGALVSVELGSVATVATILASRALGVPTIDSDYVGRAKPEVVQSKLAIHGIPRAPMAFADRWGNVSLVTSAVSDMMADRIGRRLSVAAYGGGLAASGYLLPLAVSRVGMVRGSLLRAVDVGRALRVGLASSDRLAPLRAATGGDVLFQGRTVETRWETDDPYTFRVFTYHVEGTGRFAGERARVWVKNEHHVLWRGDRVVGTSPDLLIVLDARTNRPLGTRGEVTPGHQVIVFGMAAMDAAWYSPKGLELLGPRHFGFDFDRVPLAFAE
jgi:DUF917 family protein